MRRRESKREGEKKAEEGGEGRGEREEKIGEEENKVVNNNGDQENTWDSKPILSVSFFPTC